MKHDKILFITGASSEVGCELIKEVADNYTQIWSHYNTSVKELNSIRNVYGDKIVPIQADFSNEHSVENMVKKILDSGKYPDHIVHLAAPKVVNLQFHKCRWNDYQKNVDTSLRSIVMILEGMIPIMQKQRYGRIVFMLSSSILGNIPPKFQSPYITIKYALYGLMRTLASEYASRGITVNSVSPDMMETKFLSEIQDLIIKKNAEQSPLSRNMTVKDVIPAINYLLSDKAEAVTAQNIGITGGRI